MTSGFGPSAQPPARRDNGLRADQFVALADVDPRLGEHLLDLLRLAEIPAYLEPSTDPRVAVRYRSSGPVERLYVHADQRQEARAVVVAAAREAGESAEPVTETPTPVSTPRRDVLEGIDTDAEFARIVSGFSTASPSRTARVAPGLLPDPATDAGVPAEPVASDTDVSSEPAVPAGTDASCGTAESSDTDVSAVSRVPGETGVPADLPTSADPSPVNRHGIDPADLVRDLYSDNSASPVTAADLDAAADAGARARAQAELNADQAEDADDHFHPPTAPPFPVPTANTVSALLLLVLGVLVLLRGDLFGLGSTGSFPVSIMLMLAASALIIRGLRDQPDPDDEPEDDGAEV